MRQRPIPANIRNKVAALAVMDVAEHYQLAPGEDGTMEVISVELKRGTGNYVAVVAIGQGKQAKTTEVWVDAGTIRYLVEQDAINAAYEGR